MSLQADDSSPDAKDFLKWASTSLSGSDRRKLLAFIPVAVTEFAVDDVGPQDIDATTKKCVNYLAVRHLKWAMLKYDNNMSHTVKYTGVQNLVLSELSKQESALDNITCKGHQG